LARPEIERQQFVRSIDDREDESHTAWDFRDLNIKSRIFFRHLRNIIRKRFTPLLGSGRLPRLRKRRRALSRGLRGLPLSDVDVCDFCDLDSAARVQTSLNNAKTPLGGEIHEVHLRIEFWGRPESDSLATFGFAPSAWK